MGHFRPANPPSGWSFLGGILGGWGPEPPGPGARGRGPKAGGRRPGAGAVPGAGSRGPEAGGRGKGPGAGAGGRRLLGARLQG